MDIKITLKRIAVVLLASMFVVGCTSVPTRFKAADRISDRLGYIIEQKTEKSFYLETFYHEYSFIPNPDEAIENARTYFVKLAQDLAAQEKREILPIVKSALTVNATRNIIDGRYSVYVTGQITYK